MVGLCLAVFVAGFADTVNAQCEPPAPSAPIISAIPGPNHKQITMTVNYPANATTVSAYFSSDQINYTWYGNFTPGNLTGILSLLDTNKTYYFYATATNACGSNSSGVISATTFDINVPLITATAGPNHKQITISTNYPTGTDTLAVYFSADNINYTWYGNLYPGNLTGILSQLDTHKKYWFYATATSGTQTKTSAVTDATTFDIDAPTLAVSLGPSDTQITISTNYPTGADTVMARFSIDGENDLLYGNFTPNNTTGILSQIDRTKTYCFKIIATSGTRTKVSPEKCIDGMPDQEAGAFFCDGKQAPKVVAKPVNVTNGNMYVQQTDYSLPGIGESIDVSRTYNSILQFSGVFGFGWATQYDENITSPSANKLRLAMPDGRAVYFGRTAANAPFTPSTRGFYGNIVRNTDNSYTLTFKDGRIHQFNAAGKLLWQKDRDNNQTTLTYNASNQLTGITDAFGRVLTVTPNANGTISQLSDSIGLVANYVYNANGTLQAVTYPDNSKYQFEYTTINGKILLTTVKDALNNILEFHEYDSLGRATTSELQGGVEKYTLDYSQPTFTTVTDALGRVTKYYFDKSRGRNVVTKTEGNCACGGSGSEVTQYFYDDQLNIVKKVDANNNEIVYTYDSSGNRLTQTDVLGLSTFTYNGFGQVLTATDRMSGVTTNTYNTAGNLLTTTDALGKVTTLTYTALGQLATVKDARNKVTTMTYDSFGRLTQVKDANLKNTIFTYDTRNRLLTQKNALNFTTTFAYDLNNRINKITHPDAKFIEYGYDLAGRRISMKDERGNISTYGYDGAYRMTSMINALTHITSYGYDLMSNRISMTDAVGNITNHEYDEFNRLKKTIYPPATVGATRLEERIEYDLIGNVKKRIDTANRETIYTYDTAHRLIKTTDADLKETNFEYNPRNQMTKVTDALSQEYVFAYDALGRQLSQSRASSTMSYEYDSVGNRTKRTDYLNQVTSYAYDNLNRLTNITYPDATENVTLVYDNISRLTKATKNAQDVTFIYDNRNRPTSTTDVHGKIVAMTYDNASNRTALKLGGVNFSTYTYDIVNRLTKITNSSDAKAVTYLYDNANRMTKETLPNGIASTFAYDGMSRLTEINDKKGATTLFDRDYSYNQASQISQIAELAQTRNFNYDTLDRLTSVTGSTNEAYSFDGVGNRTSSHLSAGYSYQPNNRLSNTASTSYVYNSNGNMTSKTEVSGTTSYVWDFENRLKQVILPNAQVVNYKYDALGRRSERNVNSTTWTRFTYDGLDVMLDQNSDGSQVTYLNGLGIDNKLRQTVNGQAQYFLNDHLGSTNALTDATGNIIASTNYDSFGNATNSSIGTRYQYTGREFDSLTGLQYSRARFYSPELGRFISEDPIGFAGLDPNLYGYVASNPMNLTDPIGLHVEATFSQGSGTLTVKDWRGGWLGWIGDWIFGPKSTDEFKTFSGGCKCHDAVIGGPIPKGMYLVDKEVDKNGDAPWKKISYRLYASQSDTLDGPFKPQKDVTDPITGNKVTRDNFYIHPGSNSLGCITFQKDQDLEGGAPWSSDFGRFSDILKNTSPYTYKGQSFGGYVSVVE